MEGRAREESALCLACGLCCTGALHVDVEVKPEHAAAVRTLGLTLQKADAVQTFRLPCPLYLDSCCSVYTRRPPSCQEFRCALLRKYAGGDVDLETAIGLAAEARSLIAQGASRPLSPGEPDRDVVLRAAALDVLLTKHFR